MTCEEMTQVIREIGRCARSDGQRTFDDCIHALGWIDDHCRQALASIPVQPGTISGAVRARMQGSAIRALLVRLRECGTLLGEASSTHTSTGAVGTAAGQVAGVISDVIAFFRQCSLPVQGETPETMTKTVRVVNEHLGNVEPSAPSPAQWPEDVVERVAKALANVPYVDRFKWNVQARAALLSLRPPPADRDEIAAAWRAGAIAVHTHHGFPRDEADFGEAASDYARRVYAPPASTLKRAIFAAIADNIEGEHDLTNAVNAVAAIVSAPPADDGDNS